MKGDKEGRQGLGELEAAKRRLAYPKYRPAKNRKNDGRSAKNRNNNDVNTEALFRERYSSSLPGLRKPGLRRPQSTTPGARHEYPHQRDDSATAKSKNESNEARNDVTGAQLPPLVENPAMNSSVRLVLGAVSKPDDVESDLREEEKHVETRSNREEYHSRKTQFVVGLVAIFLVLALLVTVILLLVFLLPAGSSEAKEQNETPPQEMEEYALALFPSTTLKALKEPNSPQAKAFEWLTKDSSFLGRTYSDAKIRQRFGLATFYYATGGPIRWKSSNWLEQSVDECDWFGLQCSGKNSSSMAGELHAMELLENRLLGTLPNELFWLTNLIALDLGGNKIMGTFPTQLSKLSHLEKLKLGYNKFEGSLPRELGLLTNLTILNLDANSFVGEIRSQLGMLRKLEDLHFSRNSLSGNIPKELENLDKLVDLFLNANELTGNVPSELGRLASLERLDLGANELNGRIPSELGMLEKLEELNLEGNDLTGPIPSELGSIQSLENLDLSMNQLSGIIPSELGGIAVIALHDNELTGTVPFQLLTPGAKVDVHGNLLAGQV